MAFPVIETKNLTKKFGTFTAVDDLNLKINSGEIYGLLGPNGAGKTTTIKMFCGILLPTSGDSLIFGKKVTDKSIVPNIGYMPQEIAFYPGLTVHQNMEFFGRLFGLNNTLFYDLKKNYIPKYTKANNISLYILIKTKD